MFNRIRSRIKTKLDVRIANHLFREQMRLSNMTVTELAEEMQKNIKNAILMKIGFFVLLAFSALATIVIVVIKNIQN